MDQSKYNISECCVFLIDGKYKCINNYNPPFNNKLTRNYWVAALFRLHLQNAVNHCTDIFTTCLFTFDVYLVFIAKKSSHTNLGFKLYLCWYFFENGKPCIIENNRIF